MAPAAIGIFPLCSKLMINFSQLESTEISRLSNIRLSAADKFVSQAAKQIDENTYKTGSNKVLTIFRFPFIEIVKPSPSPNNFFVCCLQKNFNKFCVPTGLPLIPSIHT